MNKPELMAPAGDRTMLTAAIKNGADAVYFGLNQLNMRAKAKNFVPEDLLEIVTYCKSCNVKTYLTINTIIYEEELIDLDKIISLAKNAGIDMIICWDLSVIQKCKEYDMPFCISTQASISNSVSANFYKNLGAKRIVLARECNLEEVKKIRANTDIEIEAFIHGAMCIAVSGRCFMSHHMFGKSANRGECIQPCRRDYEIVDHQIDKSMILGEDYVLSPKDLCSIEYIDKLIEAGINSFKIEGRKRSPEYVARVTAIYRKAIDLYFEDELTDTTKKEMLHELEKVYNRGFSAGFYFDIPASEEYTKIYGSIASTRKEFVGKVINYYKKTNIAHIRLETGKISTGDELLIIGPTTGVAEHKLERMQVNDSLSQSAGKGDNVTFECKDTIRSSDTVYKIVKV